MLQSLIPSLKRVAITSHKHAALLRPVSIPCIISSQTTTQTLFSFSTSPIPPIISKSKNAPPEKIAEAKKLIISESNPRSQHLGKRNFPSYRGLPVNDKVNTREPTKAPDGKLLRPSQFRYDTGVTPEDMPFLHHIGHDHKPKPKFKSPRKRASKLLHQLQVEKVEESKKSKPEVWEVPFKVGDALELEVLDEGGVDNPNNKPLDVIRGVVLGRENKGLDTAIYLKDVLYGEHVERKVKLHSPMVKSLKVLEEGFINRGKKKGRRIKRAKLYYMRDRKPEGEFVCSMILHWGLLCGHIFLFQFSYTDHPHLSSPPTFLFRRNSCYQSRCFWKTLFLIKMRHVNSRKRWSLQRNFLTYLGRTSAVHSTCIST